MTKGTRREREAREIYEAAGFWVYSPQNPKFGDNDLWNLFDLAAFCAPANALRFVQVKSNGARGIRKWSTVAKEFAKAETIETDFVIPYDREGWRLVRPGEESGTHVTVYDEREYSVSMGDGLTQFLKGELQRPAPGDKIRWETPHGYVRTGFVAEHKGDKVVTTDGDGIPTEWIRGEP